MALSSLASAAQQPIQPRLVSVDRSAMPSAGEIRNWLKQKDSWGPAYTGGPGWKEFMNFLHGQMKSIGMVNLTDFSFPYTRWYTTEYPDKTGWSLVSDGAAVEVADYGTQSGSTGPGGVTASMILYDLNLPAAERPALAALAGKIVVVKQQAYESFGTPSRVPLGIPAPERPAAYCGNPPLCKPAVSGEGNPSTQWGNPGPLVSYKDYEYRSDSETFPPPFERAPVGVEASFRNRDQFGQIRQVITDVLIPSGAVGAVTVMDMSPLAAAGARIHPTPRQFNVPLLMLDRVAGAKVLRDAAVGKTAKLVLNAHEEENATAYEVVATLPGRNFGTPKDQSILLATHVDGPSVVEDDGALGILAVLRYYAQIPQSERPKSIIVYLESRHFIPGTEASYPSDVVKDRPELFKSVVGGLALEHFGGLQFAEQGNSYAPTGRAAATYFWGWPNPFAIEEATLAIKAQGVPRAINDVPARPGVHGWPQQAWLGGGFSRYLVDLGGWPGWHISGDWPSAGFQAYYPAAETRVDADLFLKQASAAVQLVNVLMAKDVIALAPVWGYFDPDGSFLPDTAFLNPDQTVAGRAMLARWKLAVITSVREGRYQQALTNLRSMPADRFLIPVEAEKINSIIREATNWAERGMQWEAQGLLAPSLAAMR